MSARDLSAEERHVALAAFALEGGREKQTQKLLRAAKIKVSMATLRNWAYNVHKELYQQISLEVEKEVRTKMADTYHRLAQTSAELSEDMLGRIKADLGARDSELLEVDAALERLGEIGDDDKETLRFRKELWELRDRLRIELRDLAKLLHESGVMGGIATDKLGELTGRATVRVEHSFPELQRALEAKGIRLLVGQGAPRALPAPVELPAVNGDG